MSLYPFFFDHHYHPRQPPRRLLDQHFGLELTPDDFLSMVAIPQINHDYYRPWRNLLAAAQDVGSTIKKDKDKFQVNLDVQHFAPEEISVKTVDGYVSIEGKHEEKQDDHGFISRSFTRRYALPKGVDPETVVSKLSSDGVLSITAPLKPPQIAANERVVPIAHTGPVRKQVEDKKEEGEKEEDKKKQLKETRKDSK